MVKNLAAGFDLKAVVPLPAPAARAGEEMVAMGGE
jgi:hypothetical protein